MELRHLRYFVAVAEELNFSRAAERLHVSQPPLSRQIRDLEADLKVILLERDRQSVRLTRAGRGVLTRARKLLGDADALRNEARRIDKGKLRINSECDDALGIVAAVESGRGVAVTGQFITTIAGNRVCFVPFAGGANFLEVGLLYRQGAPNERVKKLLQAISNGSE